MKKVNKITREKLDWLLSLNLDMKLELLRNHIELSRILINEILDIEVSSQTGKRYSHNKPNGGRYSRWGYNPGSIRLGTEKVPVEVPRIYDNKEGNNKPLEYYNLLKSIPAPSEEIMDKIILGISQRDYQRVSRDCIDSFGLSQSSVSRMFMESTAKTLKDFGNRNISEKDIVVLIIDGKTLAHQEIIICLGVTIKGEKIVLDFVQSTTENSRAIKQLLKQLINRGLDYSKGLLVVSDGSKAIAKAIREVFGDKYLHQRCQWHKREDVVSYLGGDVQVMYRKRLQRAYREPDYKKAKEMLLEIGDDLKTINISALNSLKEGFEETLTLHKLGLVDELGPSLGTTNCIESLNSQLGRYIKKVTRWQNSEQIFRWVAAGLMESERRMNRIRNHKSLKTLREKLMKTLNIKIPKLQSKAA